MRFNCRSTPQAADTLSETEIKSSKRAKSKAKASSKKKAKTGGATSNTPAKQASVAPHPSPLPHVLCPPPVFIPSSLPSFSHFPRGPSSPPPVLWLLLFKVWFAALASSRGRR